MPIRLSTLLMTSGSALLLLLATACTKATTTVSRELSARPRIEQVALGAAMEAAYNKVNFGFCRDKKCFVDTRSLSKSDSDFTTSYVTQKVLVAGGVPVLNEAGADLKLTNTLDVSGTDEVKRTLLKNVVVGQIKGTLTVIDKVKGTVQQVFDLNAVAQTKRDKFAETTILGL